MTSEKIKNMCTNSARQHKEQRYNTKKLKEKEKKK